MRLRPEAVIMPDGSRYMLHAMVTGTPGSRTVLGMREPSFPHRASSAMQLNIPA